MNKISLLSIVSAALMYSACTSNTHPKNENNDTMADYVDTEHTSQNALDWQGTYEATLPCADCPGIQTVVTLANEGTLTYKANYLERNSSTVDSGTFVWESNGSIVHLTGKEVDIKFQVGENQLFHLDQEGNRIEGELAENYILRKQD